ncbi:MAG TPA: ArsI/CadI family heavy metal resistance metalloenzyme [Euzebyales bacterium]
MRLQLALNVEDLDGAVDFYSRMFDTTPTRRPGYANFAIDEPPLKLVLFSDAGPAGSINHLGVETETPAEVVDAEQRLSGAGLTTTGVDDTECCYAQKTETWLNGPDGTRWEWYVRKGDSDQFTNVVVNADASVAEGCASGSCTCC